MNSMLQDKMRSRTANFHLPRYGEITDVGLYLNQTVKFINGYLAPLGEADITDSMISNYVKRKLVENPKKKQYHTEHIARLIFISVAKTVMTLEDIDLIMKLQHEQYELCKAYDYFCDEFENMLSAVFGAGIAESNLGDTESEAKELLKTAITSIVHKIYIDQYLAVFRENRELEQKHKQHAKTVTIKKVFLDETGRVFVQPDKPSADYKLICRSATDINYDDTIGCFSNCDIEEQSAIFWFQHICEAAESELGIVLRITGKTEFHGINDDIKAQIITACTKV